MRLSSSTHDAESLVVESTPVVVVSATPLVSVPDVVAAPVLLSSSAEPAVADGWS